MVPQWESAPKGVGEPKMWIRHLTVILTWLLGGCVFGLALLFLAASWTQGLLRFVVDWGHWLTLIPITLFPIAVLLRFRAGLMMLNRGHLDDALRYCKPRAQTSLTVGRDEAALNCYVAAEVLRRQGAPETALELLNTTGPAPIIAAHRQLLSLAKALSLLALDKTEEAHDCVAPLGQPQGREALRALETFKTLSTPQ